MAMDKWSSDELSRRMDNLSGWCAETVREQLVPRPVVGNWQQRGRVGFPSHTEPACSVHIEASYALGSHAGKVVVSPDPEADTDRTLTNPPTDSYVFGWVSRRPKLFGGHIAPVYQIDTNHPNVDRADARYWPGSSSTERAQHVLNQIEPAVGRFRYPNI